MADGTCIEHSDSEDECPLKCATDIHCCTDIILHIAYSDVGPAVHLALRPLHHGRLRAHLRVAVRVAVVLQRAVPHHRHRPRLHLHPRPHVPRQVPRSYSCY